MNGRSKRFLELYEKCRFQDQQAYYEDRRARFEGAHRRFIVLTTLLMALTTVASALMAFGDEGMKAFWGLVAVIVPVLTTALAASNQLFAYERQAKLYRDAVHALLRAHAEAPDPNQPIVDAAVSDYVNQVEAVFRNEQGQWGQLVKEIQLTEPPKGRDLDPK